MNELMTVPPVQIGAWLACLAFTVMLANGLVKLWASVRGRPAPGELSERITKTESVLDEHSRRLKALEKNDKDLRELILAENEKLYKRINGIAEDLYSLLGKVDALLAKGVTA
jgi:FtsZ-binding cell division protein ZapB